jgi:hypothetical protein
MKNRNKRIKVLKFNSATQKFDLVSVGPRGFVGLGKRSQKFVKKVNGLMSWPLRLNYKEAVKSASK